LPGLHRHSPIRNKADAGRCLERTALRSRDHEFVGLPARFIIDAAKHLQGPSTVWKCQHWDATGLRHSSQTSPIGRRPKGQFRSFSARTKSAAKTHAATARVRFGSLSTESSSPAHVAYTPDSDRFRHPMERQQRATSRLLRCNKVGAVSRLRVRHSAHRATPSPPSDRAYRSLG
jgi:hypothetical protein